MCYDELNEAKKLQYIQLRIIILSNTFHMAVYYYHSIWCGFTVLSWTTEARRVSVCVCVYLVVAPKPGQAIGVHDAEDFALWILPADVILVPAVWQELIDVVPQQPAVCNENREALSEF